MLAGLTYRELRAPTIISALAATGEIPSAPTRYFVIGVAIPLIIAIVFHFTLRGDMGAKAIDLAKAKHGDTHHYSPASIRQAGSHTSVVLDAYNNHEIGSVTVDWQSAGSVGGSNRNYPQAHGHVDGRQDRQNDGGCCIKPHAACAQRETADDRSDDRKFRQMQPLLETGGVTRGDGQGHGGKHQLQSFVTSAFAPVIVAQVQQPVFGGLVGHDQSAEGVQDADEYQGNEHVERAPRWQVAESPECRPVADQQHERSRDPESVAPGKPHSLGVTNQGDAGAEHLGQGQ